MRDIKELTVIVCAYKANKEFKLCLHQLTRYGFTGNNVIIYENSPNTYKSNREFLNRMKISYIDNPDGQFAPTVETALAGITTRYALLLHSDCFCIADPIAFFAKMATHGIQLMGDICGDRGGYHIHKRVHPWWCLIDVGFMKEHNIPFTDMKKINESGSISFVDRTKFTEPRDPRGYYYDIGSTMFEDILAAGGIAADIGDNKPFIHIEGASWRREIKQYEETVAMQDNWVAKLYDKLQYDEKFVSLLGSEPVKQEEAKTEEVVEDAADN